MNKANPDSLLRYKEELLEKVKTMNLFHDTFLSVVFKNEEACEHLIRGLKIMDEFAKYYIKEGETLGSAKGEEAGIKLMQKLYALGRMQDAERVVKDKAYRNALMKEFAIQ